MSNTHTNIMGLNTGVFFTRINGLSSERFFFSKKFFKPRREQLLRVLLLSMFFVATASSNTLAKEEVEADVKAEKEEKVETKAKAKTKTKAKIKVKAKAKAKPRETVQIEVREVISQEFVGDYAGFSENWSGFYLGASVGGGWGNSRTTYDRAGNNHLTPETISPSGYLASLTLGYNYKLSNNIVIGIEGDIGVMDIDASDRTGLWDGHVWKSQYGGMWGTLRGRLGYAFDNFMIYGTGGLAFMETDEKILGDNDATQNTYNEGVHTGWVIGGGIEYALTENITTKIEYLHMEFGKYSGYTNNNELYTFENDVDIVRVGLNYKF